MEQKFASGGTRRRLRGNWLVIRLTNGPARPGERPSSCRRWWMREDIVQESCCWPLQPERGTWRIGTPGSQPCGSRDRNATTSSSTCSGGAVQRTEVSLENVHRFASGPEAHEGNDDKRPRRSSNMLTKLTDRQRDVVSRPCQLEGYSAQGSRSAPEDGARWPYELRLNNRSLKSLAALFPNGCLRENRRSHSRPLAARFKRGPARLPINRSPISPPASSSEALPLSAVTVPRPRFTPAPRRLAAGPCLTDGRPSCFKALIVNAGRLGRPTNPSPCLSDRYAPRPPLPEGRPGPCCVVADR